MSPEVVLAAKKNSFSGREERSELTSGEKGKVCTCEGGGWERSRKGEGRERRKRKERERKTMGKQWMVSYCRVCLLLFHDHHHHGNEGAPW